MPDHSTDEQVEILADQDRPGGYLLLSDRVRQSYVNVNDPTHLEYPYVAALADLIDALPPGPLDVLHLGGGAGTLARYVAHTRPGSRQTLVEVQPAVVELIRRRLPYRAGAEPDTIVGDAREVVESVPPESMDVVILDAFRCGAVPEDLTTTQFLTTVGRIVRGEGLFAVNVMDGPGWVYSRRLAAGLATVWPELVLRAEPESWGGADFGNVVLAAAARLPPAAVLDDRSLRYVSQAFSGPRLTEFVGAAVPFTDGDASVSPQPPDEDWRV